MKRFLKYIKHKKSLTDNELYKPSKKIDNRKLPECTDENTRWLSLEGLICECKVLSVYDADTVTIALHWNNNIYKVKCRLFGIDSAEKRTKNQDEKKAALEATKWLQNIILDKIIWVKCGKWGKYGGRMLGELYLNKKDIDSEFKSSINNLIVKNGFAYYYNGKKEKEFSEWYNK